jgi:segregation and condensation protein A
VDDSSGPVSEALQLHLEGFEGPLDVLLDLARRQRVDLKQISILTLVDQYLAAVSAAGQIDLARAGDWLVMAAWLTWLKSRLLLPADVKQAQDAERAAQVLTDRLARLERVRATTIWLERQPQLGRDIFERGRPEPPPERVATVVNADFLSLFEACLSVLKERYKKPLAAVYSPHRRALWTPSLALARMRGMLTAQPGGGDLLGFVPRLSPDQPHRQFRTRAAIASTLLAGLELARGAEVSLDQDVAWGPIAVRPQPDRATSEDLPAA